MIEHALGRDDESALRWAVGGHLFAVTVKSAGIGGRSVVLQTNERSRADAEARSLRGRRARVFERSDTAAWRRVK